MYLKKRVPEKRLYADDEALFGPEKDMVEAIIYSSHYCVQGLLFMKIQYTTRCYESDLFPTLTSRLYRG